MTIAAKDGNNTAFSLGSVTVEGVEHPTGTMVDPATGTAFKGASEATLASIAAGVGTHDGVASDGRGIFAAIVNAKNQQERAGKLALIAQAERESQQAAQMLAQAIEAEQIARQQMMDFDIAFVAAVLAEM